MSGCALLVLVHLLTRVVVIGQLLSLSRRLFLLLPERLLRYVLLSRAQLLLHAEVVRQSHGKTNAVGCILVHHLISETAGYCVLASDCVSLVELWRCHLARDHVALLEHFGARWPIAG